MATKKTKVGSKEVKPKKGLAFKLEVRVNELVYKGEAESLEQAVADFVASPVYPFAVKTPVVIRYGNEKKEQQVIWPVMIARRKLRLMKIKPILADLIGGKFTSNLANE